jgi:hypothetical protein
VEALLREALALELKLLGENSMHTAVTSRSLANVVVAGNRAQEGEVLYRKVSGK